MSISKTHAPMGADSQGQLFFNSPLAEHTSWRVGGPARRLYKPADANDLSFFLKQISPDEPLLWLGLGSNTLIKDGGFKGTVILTQGCLKGIHFFPDDTIRVEAGVSCAQMARFSARNHFSGGEFWAGIPGTMGGALRMNAGCFDGETWQSVVEVETINRYGEIRVRQPDEFQISYRHVSGLMADEWFIAAKCRLNPGNKESSLQVIKQLLAQRTQTQPTGDYSCGSVFRNPKGDHAARLIESCGLKGKRYGYAQVSSKHANFIINEQGRASAKEIESLIYLVQNTVYERTGIELVCEVHIMGDE